MYCLIFIYWCSYSIWQASGTLYWRSLWCNPFFAVTSWKQCAELQKNEPSSKGSFQVPLFSFSFYLLIYFLHHEICTLAGTFQWLFFLLFLFIKKKFSRRGRRRKEKKRNLILCYCQNWIARYVNLLFVFGEHRNLLFIRCWYSNLAFQWRSNIL